MNKGLISHFSDLRGFSFDIWLNKSNLHVSIGCDSVYTSFPAEVAGDIHPQEPGTADSLQHPITQYILHLERVHQDDTLTTWHLAWLNSIFHLASHGCSMSRPPCCLSLYSNSSVMCVVCCRIGHLAVEKGIFWSIFYF